MAPGAMNICRKNLAPKNLDVAKPQIEIAIKPAEVRVDTVSIIMASKSVKIHSAAKKCCGREEPAICGLTLILGGIKKPKKGNYQDPKPRVTKG